MRERSITIYADNEEDFKKIIKETEKKKQLMKKKKCSKFFSALGFEDDLSGELDGFTKYEISAIPQTIQEKEKNDEGKLLEIIEEMNKNFRKFSTNFSVKGECESFQGDMLFSNIDIKEKLQLDSPYSERESSSSSTSLEESIPCFQSTSDSPSKFQKEKKNIEVFFKQNLVNYDDIIKLIIIGEKGVGKTLFVHRLTSTESNEKGRYTPTESLEIKKTLMQVLEQTINLETWDTNLEILNSELVKTYYKICHGFILIADFSRIETLNFLEQKIESIYNMSNYNDNIFLIVNRKNRKVECDKNTIEVIENKIKQIEEQFHVSVFICDLFKFTKSHSDFVDFMKKVLHKKSISNKRNPVSSKFSTSSISTSTSDANQNEIELNITTKRIGAFSRKLSDALNIMNISVN